MVSFRESLDKYASDDDSLHSSFQASFDLEDDLREDEEIPVLGETAATSNQPLTPRTRFISSCIAEGLNPRASMVSENYF